MSTPPRKISLALKTSDGQPLSGFRWFWAQVVTGFDDRHHCLKCLKGTRVRAVTPHWVPGKAGRVDVLVPDGALLYVCGVEQSYEWASNFHLALCPGEGDELAATTFNGHAVHVCGAVRLKIRAKPAAARYPERDASFLTCRNFQFGAHYFGRAEDAHHT